MNVDLNQAGIAVQKHRSLPIRSAPGTQVLVLLGCVWITQEGDRRDYILSSGETMVVSRSGLTLLTALEDSSVSLLQPQEIAFHAINQVRLGDDEMELLIARAKQLRAEHLRRLLGRLRDSAQRLFLGLRAWVHHAALETRHSRPRE
jgi:hypothetical protein